jgi:hypothetical protein
LQLYVLVKLRMGMEFENFTYLATNEKTYIWEEYIIVKIL